MKTAALRSFFVAMLLANIVGCISESNFRLSDESRLPKWFELPDGKTREDVIVTLHYYVLPTGGSAKLILKERDVWNSIEKITGKLRGSGPIRLGSDSTNGYPIYEVLSAEGITDIIEHRAMNDLFYMTDDPAVWKELGVKQN